jgi:hypothetical protein
MIDKFFGIHYGLATAGRNLKAKLDTLEELKKNFQKTINPESETIQFSLHFIS